MQRSVGIDELLLGAVISHTKIPFTFYLSFYLLLFLSVCFVSSAKHIVVVYDTSGSMFRLKNEIYMNPEDIGRVNSYLSSLLFDDLSVSPNHPNDSQIKRCDTAYVDRPLYQKGDLLTYCEYDSQRRTKIDRNHSISRQDFGRHLPDSTNLRKAFYGKVSYLQRAEVDVYNDIYKKNEETFWIFITDGDVDHSGKSDPDIADVLKTLAEIEETYYTPLVVGLFVNNHVKIEVRKIHERSAIETIFISNQKAPREPIEQVQFSTKNELFTSETFTIRTQNYQTSLFQLYQVRVEIIDETLTSILNEEDKNIIELNGSSPPDYFQLKLPMDPAIAKSGNKVRLTVTYSFNGLQRSHRTPALTYSAHIDSIYVTANRNQTEPITELEFRFTEGKYVSQFFVRTQSPKADEFRLNEILTNIQYRDGGELCEVDIPHKNFNFNQPVRMEVKPIKQVKQRLGHYGNKLALEIKYQYLETPKTMTVAVPYKLRGNSGFPIWLFLLVLLVPLLIVAYLLWRWILEQQRRSYEAIRIQLTKTDQEGIQIESPHFFSLSNGDELFFSQDSNGTFVFDVDSDASIVYDEREIIFFEDIEDEEGQVLDEREKLELKRKSDNESIWIELLVVVEQSDDPDNDEYAITTASREQVDADIINQI